MNILLPFKLHTRTYLTYVIQYPLITNITSSIHIASTNTESYLPSDQPNITNLIVSDYDWGKQHNLRRFNLLKMKQCPEALSNIQYANVQARVRVRAKAKRVKAFKCAIYAKKESSKAQLNTDALMELDILMYMLHIHKTHTTLVVHALKYFYMRKPETL